MSEEMVVRQCAPTLAGIKTGSLFPCPCTDRDALLDEVRQLNRRLSPKGLCLLPLRFTEGSAAVPLPSRHSPPRSQRRSGPPPAGGGRL